MSSHELSGTFLYIHPPLSIIGYVFIFLFALSLIRLRNFKRPIVKFFGIAAWLFTLLGLITGMIWAQIAWGSYWSWDPKETLTLLLFSAISAGQVTYFEGKRNLTRWFALLSCILVVITTLSSFIIAGLHSFA